MNEGDYHKFYKYEETFWWFLGRRRTLFSILEKHLNGNGTTLNYLDVGCGTGGCLKYFTKRLKGLRKNVKSYGLDFHALATRYCKLRNLPFIVQASATHIPFKSGQFDVVLCLDVLSSIRDDISAARELHRVCRDGGKVLICDVAFMFLMDENSISAHVLRRYTRSELINKLEATGFRIVRATYANSILFPPITVLRLLIRLIWGLPDRSQATSDVRPYPPLLNFLFYNLLIIEENLLRWINFPFGVSVILLAEKK